MPNNKAITRSNGPNNNVCLHDSGATMLVGVWFPNSWSTNKTRQMRGREEGSSNAYICLPLNLHVRVPLNLKHWGWKIDSSLYLIRCCSSCCSSNLIKYTGLSIFQPKCFKFRGTLTPSPSHKISSQNETDTVFFKYSEGNL